MLLIIINLLIVINDSTLTKFIARSIAAVDVYTNYINVILINKAFDRYYTKLCSSLDRKYNRCWMKLLAAHQNEKQLSNMMNVKVSDEADTSVAHSTITNKTQSTFLESIQ